MPMPSPRSCTPRSRIATKPLRLRSYRRVLRSLADGLQPTLRSGHPLSMTPASSRSDRGGAMLLDLAEQCVRGDIIYGVVALAEPVADRPQHCESLRMALLVAEQS